MIEGSYQDISIYFSFLEVNSLDIEKLLKFSEIREFNQILLVSS